MSAEQNTLRTRALKSVNWTVSGHFIGQFLRLFSNLILTRLLAPEMFGVMAVVYLFIIGIHMFTDIGLIQNVVSSKRSDEKTFLDTIWTIQIIKSFVVFLFSVPIAVGLYYSNQLGWLAQDRVYVNPELPYLIVAVSLTSIVSGFSSVNLLVLNKKLMMGKVVSMELLSQLIGLIFLVTLAWFWRDIWALAIGNLFTATLRMIFSHHSSLGPRYHLGWDKSAVNEIVNFGKWIFLSTILGFALGQGDRILLSLWLTPTELGVYSIAFFLGTALKLLMQKVMNSVFYPVLSEINREQPERLSEIYYRIRAKVDFFTMTVAGFMASTGALFIRVLYDDRYIEAGWMLEILSLSVLFVGYMLAGSVLIAKGDGKRTALLTFIATAGFFISVVLSYNLFGITGALFAIALNGIIDLPGGLYMMKKYNVLKINKEFRMLPLFFVAYGIGTVLEIFITDWFF